MFQKILFVFKIYFGLLVMPIRTIKDYEVLNYSKKKRSAINQLFLLIVINSITMNIYNLNNKSAVHIHIQIIIMIIALLLIKIIGTFIYYIFFMLGTNNKDTSYKSIEILLFPVIRSLLLLNIFYVIIVFYFPFIRIALNLIINSWFNITIFAISKYKLGQSDKKSVILASISFLLISIFLFI